MWYLLLYSLSQASSDLTLILSQTNEEFYFTQSSCLDACSVCVLFYIFMLIHRLGKRVEIY